MPKPTSLLAKYYTPAVAKELQSVKTPHGVTVADVIRSGVENPDSSVGVYAGDAQAYQTFAPLLRPVVADYHKHDLDKKHQRDLNPAHLRVTNLDPSGESILSTRVRVGRNIDGYAFPAAISKKDRSLLERKIVQALGTLKGI